MTKKLLTTFDPLSPNAINPGNENVNWKAPCRRLHRFITKTLKRQKETTTWKMTSFNEDVLTRVSVLGPNLDRHPIPPSCHQAFLLEEKQFHFGITGSSG